MNTHEALLHAIQVDPADDTARLVYADWCDENGRGWHAELIRLQVGGCTRDELQAVLDRLQRNVETISAMRRTFLAGEWTRYVFGETMAGWDHRKPSTVVRRGFNDEWHASSHQWNEQICRRLIFRSYPITRVRLPEYKSHADLPSVPNVATSKWRCWYAPVQVSRFSYGRWQATLDIELFSRLPRETAVMFWEAEGAIAYSSDAAAHAALSAACVSWGRQDVGLPQLETHKEATS